MMPGAREVPGKLVLLDERNTVVTTPVDCVFDWSMSMGRGEFRFRSVHTLQIPDGVSAYTIALTDDVGRILWADPLIAEPRRGGQLIVEPDPSQPPVQPGRQNPVIFN